MAATKAIVNMLRCSEFGQGSGINNNKVNLTKLNTFSEPINDFRINKLRIRRIFAVVPLVDQILYCTVDDVRDFILRPPHGHD